MNYEQSWSKSFGQVIMSVRKIILFLGKILDFLINILVFLYMFKKNVENQHSEINV